MLMSRKIDHEPDSALAQPYRHSPNFGERKDGCALNYIIVHYTGMESGQAALARLMDEVCEVSCHYLIWEDGRIQQLVAEDKRAWHAGESFWRGESDLNSASIGIELVHEGHAGEPFYPPAQIAATIALCRDICQRRGIDAHHILAHSDVAPLRKKDPGEFFPWHELAAAGLGQWVEPAPLTEGVCFALGDRDRKVGHLQGYLALIGYDVMITGYFDEKTQAAVRAFQRHFRPARVDGVADPSSFATLRALLSPKLPSLQEFIAMKAKDNTKNNISAPPQKA
jgi:N-acetylmuramoyl-L-alanine amidase